MAGYTTKRWRTAIHHSGDEPDFQCYRRSFPAGKFHCCRAVSFYLAADRRRARYDTHGDLPLQQAHPAHQRTNHLDRRKVDRGLAHRTPSCRLEHTFGTHRGSRPPVAERLLPGRFQEAQHALPSFHSLPSSDGRSVRAHQPKGGNRAPLLHHGQPREGVDRGASSRPEHNEQQQERL
jgi:hypothetical protein